MGLIESQKDAEANGHPYLNIFRLIFLTVP